MRCDKVNTVATTFGERDSDGQESGKGKHKKQNKGWKEENEKTRRREEQGQQGLI